MPVLTEAQLKDYPEPTTSEVVPNYVARYYDMMALSDRQPAKVIGAEAMLRDRPGFEVELLSPGSLPATAKTHDQHVVLMPMRGHWRLSWEGGQTVLNPGDTCAVPPGVAHSLAPSMTGEASCFRVIATEDPAGATMPLSR